MSEQNSKSRTYELFVGRLAGLLGAGRFSLAEATAKNAARGRAKRVNASENEPMEEHNRKGMRAKAPPVVVVYIVVSTRTCSEYIVVFVFSGVKIE